MKHLTASCALFGALTFFVTPANAAWFTGRIDRIQITPTGGFSVYFASGTQTECGSNRIDFYDPNAANMKMILAALLAYETQKTLVQFAILSCSGTTGLFANIESEPGPG
jgi:uncharacterized protein YfaP (DUF2135 family)